MSNRQTPHDPDLPIVFQEHIALLQQHLAGINVLARDLLASGADTQRHDIQALEGMAKRTIGSIEDAARAQQTYFSKQPSAFASPQPQPPTSKVVAKRPTADPAYHNAVPSTAEPPSKKLRKADKSGLERKKDHANPYETDPAAPPVVIEEDDISAIVEERLRLNRERRAKRIDNPGSIKSPEPVSGRKRKHMDDDRDSIKSADKSTGAQSAENASMQEPSDSGEANPSLNKRLKAVEERHLPKRKPLPSAAQQARTRERLFERFLKAGFFSDALAVEAKAEANEEPPSAPPGTRQARLEFFRKSVAQDIENSKALVERYEAVKKCAESGWQDLSSFPVPKFRAPRNLPKALRKEIKNTFKSCGAGKDTGEESGKHEKEGEVHAEKKG